MVLVDGACHARHAKGRASHRALGVRVEKRGDACGRRGGGDSCGVGGGAGVDGVTHARRFVLQFARREMCGDAGRGMGQSDVDLDGVKTQRRTGRGGSLWLLDTRQCGVDSCLDGGSEWREGTCEG